MVLCGQRVPSRTNNASTPISHFQPPKPRGRNACHLSCPDRDIFHGSPCKYYTLMDENQWPFVKFKQRLQADVRRVTFHSRMEDERHVLMTSNIPSSPLSNLNRPHILVQTHTFFSSCNEGWCRPPKEPVHKHQGPQPAHIHPPKPNPAKARAHPSYIHTGTSLPTIKDHPAQVSEESTELRSLQKKITYYYLFPLFISNLVYVYLPFFTLVIFASDVSRLLFLLLLSKN